MLALILVSYQRIKHFASAGLEPWSSGMPDMHFATELCGKVGSQLHLNYFSLGSGIGQAAKGVIKVIAAGNCLNSLEK